jgi:hypothetical protein
MSPEATNSTLPLRKPSVAADPDGKRRMSSFRPFGLEEAFVARD